MSLLNQLSQLTKNLSGLGQARLMALAGVGVMSVILIIAAAVFLNKPTHETLYIGLSGDDVNQISLVLAESNINFAIGADGASVSVQAGNTSRARMVLAERGLPSSNSAGYELFDQVGSLGLTSFMQEVTRVRALEGEIARTIQSINGISAARVHIVMPDRGNFRRGDQNPSASVMVRAGNNLAGRTANSIRHLVASSVPGLNIDEVTVLDATGQLLAAGDDFSNSNLNRSLSIVQLVQGEVESNINKALAPFLGVENFRASVNAKVNTDSQQIQETVYDPESRVERSVRVTRENQTSSQSSTDAPATVEQNIPDQGPNGTGADGPQSSELSERKEEQTNFEINSKTVSTVRNSYDVEELSIAVVINKARIDAMLGGEPTPEEVDAYLVELQQVVSMASGLSVDRGDRIKVTMMDFLASELLTADAAEPGFADAVRTQLGTIINALAFITVAVLIVMFGFRPLLRSAGVGGAARNDNAMEDGLELPDFSAEALGDIASMPMEGFGADFGFGEEGESELEMEESGSFNRRVKEGPERRLARMVEINEERAAKILRSWASSEAA
ncbi:flagellar basal-body M-ring protein/flagellar hook-basal body protein FliF [Hoeflea sp. IMCC20628]|uniref:flagellar basal-body MS-ring/collar protein FliF n=1 Tax=Hoeflea sp. IMCC20628 TaxID=1620421 RepID=UPI00063AB1DE|nr:flagellar basal-body MS-ring/collar protein FliF [Hoeflea sp. IMCC20628]AKI02173.1 flagellar basal-body M-ring protein/flagellar hook-basal body protein FliF [Hoeflea sp. IMCC20628]